MPPLAHAKDAYPAGRKILNRSIIWLGLLLVMIPFLVLPAPAPAQEQNQTQTLTRTQTLTPDLSSDTTQSDALNKKDFLDNFPNLKKGRNQLKQIKQKKYAVEIRKWANKPKPPIAAFLFCCLLSGLALGFFPRLAEAAKETCRKHYWRCFGRALVTNISLFIMFRIFVDNKVTQPLAILFAGVLQFLLIAGLAISILMVGESLVGKLRLDSPGFVATRPRLKNILIIFAGALITTLFIQIPDLGKLPKPGMRIVLLIATLGEGGLLAYLRKREE